MLLNPKIMVGGIIGAFAIVIAIAGGVIGGGVIDDVSGGSLISSGSPPEIFPLVLEFIHPSFATKSFDQ